MKRKRVTIYLEEGTNKQGTPFSTIRIETPLSRAEMTDILAKATQMAVEDFVNRSKPKV